MNITLKSVFLLSCMVVFSQCATLGQKSLGGINLFTPAQDVELGKQVAKEIESNPKQYPILAERGNEEVYRYVRGIVSKILNTGQVAYRNEFVWQTKIIKDDKTLNAFCTPGGFIYVYTGLIKFLDNESQLAGVLGHEIAHAAQRHSTRQLTKMYGLSAVASVVTGRSNPGMIEKIALSLVSLKFGRTHETEADTYSVKYLCPTSYHADGAAGFFRKIEGEKTPPAFLSTHPNPGNRVQNIEKQADEIGCRGQNAYSAEYARIKRLLGSSQ